MDRPLALAALVLAAGEGSRFSGEPGAKLLAPLDGRPLLAHVLHEIRRFEPVITVVVLGHGMGAIESAIEWAGEVRVPNPTPERGLSSSLHVGIEALRSRPVACAGTFIALGDQPTLRVDVMRDLAKAAATAGPDISVVVPHYEDHVGPNNPVILMRSSWHWVDDLEGDEGLAGLIAGRPESTLMVPVPGEMPDIDTVEDLARLRSGR